MTQKLGSGEDAALPPPDGEVGDYFAIDQPQPPGDTFEIALVLGGTVSAAAYTAGVIDFLVEALDAWTIAKDGLDPAAPPHKVVIKIVTGTSGGAITSVLLAKGLGSAFQPVHDDTPADVRTKNPFYDCWIDQIDITDLLQLTDLDGARQVPSLLCAHKIDVVSAKIAAFQGGPLGTLGTPQRRSYVEPQLPVVLTLTNLRGVPYFSNFRGPSNRREYFTDEADHIRFRVDLFRAGAATPPALQPYEIAISDAPANPGEPWTTMIHAGRGSSAFPVGLPPQTISRDAGHYRYRYAVIDGHPTWLKPAWEYMMPAGTPPNSPYRFLCVDGGCFNNEPLLYARQWLEGILGDHVDCGTLAHRALILVDPFADVPSAGLIADPGLFGSAGATLAAWKSGARFETADLDLFTAEEVYSRFLVNPVRKSDDKMLTGGEAIATSCLAAFGGFLSHAFREHDFFLGRRNCQQFLRANFVLDAKNVLFTRWSAAQRAALGATAPAGCLPVVPLMNSVAAELPQPAWPKGAFDAESIRGLIDARLGRVAALEANPVLQAQSTPVRWVLDFILSKARGLGTDRIVKAIGDGLDKAGL